MKVSIGRLIAGIGFLFAFCGSAFWLHTQTENPFLLSVLAVCFAVPQISFWEWMIHGFVYHRKIVGGKKIREIHAAHHWSIFPPDKIIINLTCSFNTTAIQIRNNHHFLPILAFFSHGPIVKRDTFSLPWQEWAI